MGVTGLVRRLTLDRGLPQFLLKTNRRGTTHRIIFGFFLLCVSVLIFTEGDLGRLAAVYTISFLSVMALFGLGNVLLKVWRARLPRPERAPWPTVLLGSGAVVAGLVGNVLMKPEHLRDFLLYFVPTVAAVFIMLGRIGFLKACLYFVRAIAESLSRVTSGVSGAIRGKIDEINAQQMVFFTRGDSLANLNNAMLYLRRNEHTNRIKVCTVVRDEKEVPAGLSKELEFLDEAYPEIDIEFVVVDGVFRPELIDKLSLEWGIPKNFMFIGSPGDHFLYGLADMGGVRLII